MNLIKAIDKYGEAYPHRIAYKCSNDSITYGQLKTMSDRLSIYIDNILKEDKSPVLVYGHKQSAMLVCFLGAVKSGRAYIPVDSSIPHERLQNIIEQAAPGIVLAIEPVEIKESMPVIGEREISKVVQAPDNSYIQGLKQLSPQDDFYIIFTSGSTGTPKGVRITRANAEAFAGWIVRLKETYFKSSEIILNHALFSFDLSVMGMYMSLATGGTLYNAGICNTLELKELFKEFSQSRAQVWISTPSLAELCLRDNSFNSSLIPQLMGFIFCGEALRPCIAQELFERFKGVRIINTYGPTETTVAVTEAEITPAMCMAGENSLPISVGKGTFEICKGKDQEDRGELFIYGDGVSPGYLRDTKLTNDRFIRLVVDGKERRGFLTGDICYEKEGMLYFYGRRDSQIKIGGFRIDTGDVENNLCRLPYVEQALVQPIYRKGIPIYMEARVILKQGIANDALSAQSMIKRDVEKYIPSYMIPRRITIVEEIQLNTNGKLDRNAK